MAGACDQFTEVASAGVGPALRAVDCIAGETTAMAFGRLFGASGAMGPVLTILLTLYIAFFAISLLTGRSTLGISALTPRMLTLGLVLTFATSWIAYQGVMWNMAVGGPDWVASVLTGTGGSATQIFGDKIDLVFGAIAESAGNGAAAGVQAGAEAAAQGAAQGAQNGGSAQGLFTPQSIMWMGGILLLLGTVGVLLTARIALAVLMALGPIFVVMALFDGSRGLTAGWLRGVVLTALTPLFVVLGGSITLELLVPIVRSLSSNLVDIDGRAAMALFLVAAVHCALMVMVFKVAGTMVAGWQVFGLGKKDRSGQGSSAAAQGAVAAPAYVPAAASDAASTSTRRAALTAAVGMPADAMAAQGDAGGRSGERRTVITQVSGGGLEPIGGGSSGSRAKGIGSRFRASNDTVKSPSARPTKEMIR